MPTHDAASLARGSTPTRALIVGSAALFTDMLVHGLAVPVLLFGLAALAAVAANPIVGRFVSTASPTLLVGAGVTAVVAALLVTGYATELWQTSIAMSLLGISSALLLTPATTLISEQGFRSSPPTLGGAFALYNLAYATGLAGGPLLTGFGVQQSGFTAAMVLAAVTLALLGGASLLRLPRIHRDTLE